MELEIREERENPYKIVRLSLRISDRTEKMKNLGRRRGECAITRRGRRRKEELVGDERKRRSKEGKERTHFKNDDEILKEMERGK